MQKAVDLGTENDERMARLREALVLGDAFQLVIVQVEPGEQREEVLRRLAGWSGRGGAPKLEVVRLSSGESPVMCLVGNREGVVLVGLEADRGISRERAREMLAELNWSRDRLPQLVRGPLILVVSQRVQAALFEQAPDLYSWRSHTASIVPQWPVGFHVVPWFAQDPGDPAEIEAAIGGGASARGGPPARDQARLYARLAVARAVRGEFSQAEAAIHAATKRIRHGSTDDQVGIYLVGAAIAEQRGHLDEAASWLRRARTIASSAPTLTARARVASRDVVLDDHDAAALGAIRGAIPKSENIEDSHLEATVVAAQARLMLRNGDITASIALWERALELYRRAGDAVAEVHALLMLASAHAAAGRSDDAEQLAVTAVGRAEGSRSPDLIARARAMLGWIALDNEHVALAEEILGHDVPARSLDAVGHLAEARARLALHRDQLAVAEHRLLVALEAYLARNMTWDIAEVSLELGKLGRRMRDEMLAVTRFETAERLGDSRQRARAAFGLAELRYERGDLVPELAAQLSVATQLLVAAGNATLADMARYYRGAVLQALGREVEARSEAATALAGFEQRGQVEPAAPVRSLLEQLADE